MTAPDTNTTTMVIGTPVRIAYRFNPTTGGLAAPPKTKALFGAFAPSLMPRVDLHQGIAAEVSVLGAEAVGRSRPTRRGQIR
jgi:hypothetical protein